MKDLLLALPGLAIVVWAVYAMLRPPRKHRDFSYRDQMKATHRAMGGPGQPDPDDVLPPGARK